MKLKKLNKTKTGIMSDLYNKNSYVETYTHGTKVNACLQLSDEFPDMFTTVQKGFNEVTISINDGQLKNVFELLTYNEAQHE